MATHDEETKRRRRAVTDLSIAEYGSFPASPGAIAKVEVPADAINLGFVLGNKVMVGTVNASRADFEAGVSDLATMQAQNPDWLRRFITHRVNGLERYEEAFELLERRSGTIKVVVDVAPEHSRLQAAEAGRPARANA